MFKRIASKPRLYDFSQNSDIESGCRMKFCADASALMYEDGNIKTERVPN